MIKRFPTMRTTVMYSQQSTTAQLYWHSYPHPQSLFQLVREIMMIVRQYKSDPGLYTYWKQKASQRMCRFSPPNIVHHLLYYTNNTWNDNIYLTERVSATKHCSSNSICSHDIRLPSLVIWYMFIHSLMYSTHLCMWMLQQTAVSSSVCNWRVYLL